MEPSDLFRVVLWIGGAILALVVLILLLIIFAFITTYIRAWSAGAKVGFASLIGMKLRRVPIGLIVDARINAVKAGLPLSTDQLEAHYLAGGDVEQVVLALIAAHKAGFNFTDDPDIKAQYDRACAIDLAVKGSGKTVIDAVRTSVNPRVIDCPSPQQGRTTIDGVAQDGIQLKAKGRVTVRTNLRTFVGGATEETVIARVGEAIVTAIGSAKSYKEVLENPDRISKTALVKALDSGTAYEILSIDIADVDVGENVGAKLQAEQAEANKRMAQAQAEVRAAAARALEAEMKARTQEMQAKVVEAEAQVPLAIADSFRSGNLGIMDYYRFRNIQADTAMRTSIAGEQTPRPPGAPQT